MRKLRAILSGIIIWAIIFIEWSIMIFTPGIKDSEVLQYTFHYILLIPIVILGINYYYKTNDKTNGFLIGIIMLITGIILDAIITVPLFTLPQGVGYSEFFLSTKILAGFIEFVLISGIYWIKKIK